MSYNYDLAQVCILERTLGNKLKTCFSQFHAGTALSSSQSRALHYFLGLPKEDIFQKDLEIEFNIKASSASAIIKQLEDKGFIERENLERDSRLKKISPTEKALKLKRQVEKDIETMEKKLLKDVDKEDFNTFCQVCTKMIENLSN